MNIFLSLPLDTDNISGVFAANHGKTMHYIVSMLREQK